jgi:rubredoxin
MTSSSDYSVSEKWSCDGCNWVYDESEGDPDHGHPPGTPFAELPEDWTCPSCGGMPKEFFKQIVGRR